MYLPSMVWSRTNLVWNISAHVQLNESGSIKNDCKNVFRFFWFFLFALYFILYFVILLKSSMVSKEKSTANLNNCGKYCVGMLNAFMSNFSLFLFSAAPNELSRIPCCNECFVTFVFFLLMEKPAFVTVSLVS